MRAGLPHLQRTPTPRFVSCNPSMRLTCYLASLLPLGENRRRAVVTRVSLYAARVALTTSKGYLGSETPGLYRVRNRGGRPREVAT
jgi:hypothetical protein